MCADVAVAMRISLEQAAALLRAGDVVAVPTETVYGLAASLAHPEAIEKLFLLKGRPAQNPLIVHLADASQLQKFVKEEPPHLKELAKTFWPGPMTLVFSIFSDTIPTNARAGLSTAAFRIPDHERTRQLLHMTGPLVMPSANISGRPSATTPEHVESDFGSSLPLLDGGTTKRGVESTVLRADEGKWEIIRLGALPPAAFEPVLGYAPSIATVKAGETPICPGQLFRHYAPAAHLILTTSFHEQMQGAIVGFSDRPYSQNGSLFSLGASHDPEGVAENLYSTLRRLDEEKVPQAFVDMRFPNEGLWITLAERLTKAAS